MLYCHLKKKLRVDKSLIYTRKHYKKILNFLVNIDMSNQRLQSKKITKNKNLNNRILEFSETQPSSTVGQRLRYPISNSFIF